MNTEDIIFYTLVFVFTIAMLALLVYATRIDIILCNKWSKATRPVFDHTEDAYDIHDMANRLQPMVALRGFVHTENERDKDCIMEFMGKDFSDYMSAFILSCHHAGLSCHFIPTNACTPIDEYGNYDFIPPEGLVPKGAETYFAKVVYDVPKEPEKYF